MPEQTIKNLRVYTLARAFEDGINAIIASLPDGEQYTLANSLRRSSTAIAHHIYESHRRYSYTLKLDALYLAVAEGESTKKLLAQCQAAGYGETEQLQVDCVSIIKQCWGLIKYFQGRKAQNQAETAAKASDELVASRR